MKRSSRPVSICETKITPIGVLIVECAYPIERIAHIDLVYYGNFERHESKALRVGRPTYLSEVQRARTSSQLISPRWRCGDPCYKCALADGKPICVVAHREEPSSQPDSRHASASDEYCVLLDATSSSCKALTAPRSGSSFQISPKVFLIHNTEGFYDKTNLPGRPS